MHDFFTQPIIILILAIFDSAIDLALIDNHSKYADTSCAGTVLVMTYEGSFCHQLL